jgi:hypothetical protein
MFKHADRALYVAKAGGRDRVVSSADVIAPELEPLPLEQAAARLADTTVA